MKFSSNIAEIRRRARQEIENGAVTPGYALDVEQAIRILNEALATELVCVLRYRFHYYMASGIHSSGVAAEFEEHAEEEQEHANRIAGRIRQLGGKPEMNPALLTELSHSEYREGTSLRDMIREDLVAERIAIESYRDMIGFFGERDSTTRTILEQILSKEEEHADELAQLLSDLPQDSARPERDRDAVPTR